MLGNGGIDLQDAPVAGGRLIESAELSQGIAEVAVGLGHIRIDLNGAPVARGGFFEILHFRKYQTQIGMGFRAAGIYLHNISETVGGLVQPA